MLWFCGLPGLGMGDLIDVDMDALEGEGVIRVSNADYLRRPLRLDSSEASALIVALRALREGSADDVRPIVDRTLGKLEAAAGRRGRAGGPGRLRLPARAGPDRPSCASGSPRAVDDRRQVRLDYYVPSRDESTERVVDPLRLVTAEGNAYLDAWCHLAEDQRLFRLDRISTAEVLDTPADRARTDVRPARPGRRHLPALAGRPAGDAAAGAAGPLGGGVLPGRGRRDEPGRRPAGPAPRRRPGLADPAAAAAGRRRPGRGARRAGRRRTRAAARRAGHYA